ncbi:hypothetical protein EV586_105273 [Tumebacillus sp. BK434]|uniref:hypothetical protein n=1 Tax=Tumebacillus sp. BK434 TaxID=2512169 RepID=UPI00104DE726|nr:hypothetical protein [Tumebacillus sp. BK434]TCP53927.1 hypothetical protein EV586_105273 [Tumebacillus sp. BK434]
MKGRQSSFYGNQLWIPLAPGLQFVVDVFLAVAAASILVRDALLKWSNGAKKQYGLTLPKGASSLVIQAGKSYVKEHGKDALVNVAKLHFKTTEDVLLA